MSVLRKREPVGTVSSLHVSFFIWLLVIFPQAELKCTYVADPSVYQSQDPWSACYTLNLPDDGDSTLSTTLSLLTTTPPPVVNDGSNSDGGVQPKATAKPKATPKPKGTTTTTKLQEPTATKTTTTKPVVVDEDTTSRGSTCGSGCIQPDRTCEDWADYYTCGELESKVGCDCSGCSCAVDCVGEWSAWAECDVTCGTGRTSRSFMVLVDAAFGGEECAFSRGEVRMLILLCVLWIVLVAGLAFGDVMVQENITQRLLTVAGFSFWA